MGSRKPYPDEFKQEAVRPVPEQGLPASQVARDLGIDPRPCAAGCTPGWPTEVRRPTHRLLRPSWPGCGAKTNNCAWSAIF